MHYKKFLVTLILVLEQMSYMEHCCNKNTSLNNSPPVFNSQPLKRGVDNKCLCVVEARRHVIE